MTKTKFPFGTYLKQLREQKGVSLKDVEKETGISNAHLSQLETGARRRLPPPERLKVLADYYSVSAQELLHKAGYFGEEDIKETGEQKIDKALTHALSDPLFKTGMRVNTKNLSIDAKRFITELYEETAKRTNPSATAHFYGDNYPKALTWAIENVKRSIIKESAHKQFVKYEVAVVCFVTATINPKDAHQYPEISANDIDPDTHEVQLESLNGKAEVLKRFYLPSGHETGLLEQATNMALKDALSKSEDVNWIEILFRK